jgi:cell division septal protein FtsQ
MMDVDRLERDARARRTRANSHLTRLRERGRTQRNLNPLRRRVAAAALAAGALVGSCAGELWVRVGGGHVESIAVRGAHRLSPREVAAATGIPRGAKLADVDASAVAESLARNAWIESAKARRLPSGRVLVTVVEREPLAQLAVGARRFAIDAQGAAFAELREGEETALPRVLAEKAPERGAPDPLRVEAAKLATRLPELGLAAPAEVKIAPPDDPQGVTLRLPGLEPVVVLGRESLDSRLRDLAKLLELRRDEASRAAEIDLRFADQAVLRSAATREGSRDAAVRGGGTPSTARSAG